MPKQPILNQGESPSVLLKGFSGLSLKLDVVNRPNNSFQQLDNFDLYIPGSIRKVTPAVQYGGPYGANILNCIEYLSQPNNPVGGIRRLIGVGVDGKLYNMATGLLYNDTNALLGIPPTVPFMLQASGYYVPYNMRSWSKSTAYVLHDAVLEYGPDGNIYVFENTIGGISGLVEPIWPASGIVNDGTAKPAFSAIVGNTTIDSTVTWTCRGHAIWQAGHTYLIGDNIIDSNGNIQQVLYITGMGVSGTSAPIWATINGRTTSDTNGGDTIGWICLAQQAWRPGTSYSLRFTYVLIGTINLVILDQNGNIQQVTVAGVSSAFGNMIWTNRGIPTSTRFLSNFLHIIVPGKQPIRVNEWQYDPTSGIEVPSLTTGQMGVSAPQMPPEIGGVVVTPNLNGYAPSAGRAYQWTYYNPHTLQESAPSPFVGDVTITKADNSDTQTKINGSLLDPLPPAIATKIASSTIYSSYQSFYIAIPLSVMTPPIGQGYSAIRLYATKDGGTVFYLVTNLYDSNGNQISNADGTVPIALLTSLQATNLWTDYFPIPESQNLVASVRMYEGGGPVNLAPDPQNLGVNAWQPQIPGPSTNAIFVDSGGAPDGSNAFEIVGPNLSKNYWISSAIPVQSKQYTFQMYLDKSNGTGGTMSAIVQTAAGIVLLTLTQQDGTTGTLSGNFTPKPYQRLVKIRIFVNGVTIVADTSLIWSNPVIGSGAVISSAPTTYPTVDSALFLPAPLAFTNYPPPIAAMAEVTNDSLHLVDNSDQTKIWYSQKGQYEKYGAFAFVRTTITKNADQVLELIKCFDRLLVIKGRSVEQIATYPPQEPVSVDPQHGGLARRTSITWGSSILGLFTDGLGQIQLAASVAENRLNVGMAGELFGDDVKPLIDAINRTTLYATNAGPMLPCPTIFNKLDLLLIAYQVGNSYNDTILLYHLNRSKGFARITALPAPIITLKEIQLPANAFPNSGNGDYSMLALTTDAKSYVMFAGTQDGTVTATAVTQPLPTPSDIPEEYWDTDKSFEYLYAEGTDLPNFRVSFSIDGGTTYNPPQSLTKRFKVGKRGKSLVIKLTHGLATTNTPLLSMLKLAYRIEGVTAQ